MKQLTNVTGILLFIFLSPLIFIANKLQDIREGKKEPDPPFPPQQNIKTTYPDCTAKDFNDWAEHIHREYQKN